jgi:hypothetical protein
MDGIEQIIQERARQKSVEGFLNEHDDKHTGNELSAAAASYTIACIDELLPKLPPGAKLPPPPTWPFSKKDWKPADKIRNLVKAGALIAAEIDRLQRLPTNELEVDFNKPTEPKPE